MFMLSILVVVAASSTARQVWKRGAGRDIGVENSKQKKVPIACKLFNFFSLCSHRHAVCCLLPALTHSLALSPFHSNNNNADSIQEKDNELKKAAKFLFLAESLFGEE